MAWKLCTVLENKVHQRKRHQKMSKLKVLAAATLIFWQHKSGQLPTLCPTIIDDPELWYMLKGKFVFRDIDKLVYCSDLEKWLWNAKICQTWSVCCH